MEWEICGVYEFLNSTVPPGGTQEWERWKKQCYGFGSAITSASKIILEQEQGSIIYSQRAYSSLLALRMFGYFSSGKQVDGKWVFEIDRRP